MYRPQLGAGADGHALERAVRQHNELLRIKQALEADLSNYLRLSSLELEQRKAAAARSRHQPMKGKAAVTTAHRAGAVIHHLRDASEKLRGHMHELAVRQLCPSGPQLPPHPPPATPLPSRPPVSYTHLTLPTICSV